MKSKKENIKKMNRMQLLAKIQKYNDSDRNEGE
jgi:hypothetical protein